ncbi:diguanylate cyclase [Marinagarivorans cellulosilyticus]|uniref:diguanylate cyclase n=1 Tax=Marinagarivorans cellulosilyticus TaxID=2721545 RepID=A0AAN1WFJ9_9GAMM|nr:diguanylate cyclase [Marinagarivorans cellulosilyticus]BCD96671.1 hypothetical protein MARGE09_P0871 [Marinagarivorans cellulosilyticus]
MLSRARKLRPPPKNETLTRCLSELADPDGDGWGVEGGNKCVVVVPGTNRAVTGEPICGSLESDPDGDGWSWENDQSCIAASGGEDSPEAPTCVSPERDPDGDGWGWENEASCRVGSVTENVTEQVEITLCNNPPLGVDASEYDGLIVKVHYEGRAPYLRLNVVDSAPELLAYASMPKPMSMYLDTEVLRTGERFVRFEEFSVGEWWTVDQNPPRALAGPSFRHLTQFAFDAEGQGVHRIRIDRIDLVGERVRTESFLLAIAVIWAVYLLFEAGWRYLGLQRAYRHEQQQLEGLIGGALELEEEKELLTNLSQTDPLTQVYNRHGLSQRLRHQFGGGALPMGTGLLVFDIDHFKKLNDTYGHDAGDVVLQEFSSLMMSSIRSEDTFARWGGEEFVLVVGTLAEDKLAAMAEKLRQRVAAHLFVKDKQLPVTVSIGVAQARSGEPFDLLCQRADKALYKAKSTRNTVAYAP